MEDDFLADVPGVALSDEKIGVHPLRRESVVDREMKAVRGIPQETLDPAPYSSYA